MLFSGITGHIDLVIAMMAGISVCFSTIVVVWPYLMPDTVGARLRAVSGEREAIRIRERAKLQGNSLRSEPKKIFKDILHRLNLTDQLNDGPMVQKLRMAGYRGQGPVVTFVAARVIMPGLLFIVAAFYIFVVLRLQYPFFVKLSPAVAIALLGYYVPGIYVKNRNRQAADGHSSSLA